VAPLPAPPPVDPGIDVWAVASSVGTTVAAGFAIVAAVIAVWQARLARGARDAAVEQATIANEALTLQLAQQDQTDAPQFNLTVEAQTSHRPAGLLLRMVKGAEVDVKIEWQIRFSWRVPPTTAEPGRMIEVEHTGIYLATLVENASVLVYDEERNDADLVRALGKVSVNSTETRGQRRKWNHDRMADWIIDAP